MIKSLLILVNFFGLLVLNFFFLQKIEVEHTIPESLAPGASTEVTLTIDKGKVEGFAKLQLNVDRGLTVENVESRGASFTFSDQKAKFIWMSLPEDKTFTIRYRLKADEDAVGSLNVSGHFSYIDENQRLVYDLAPASVATGQEEVATTDPEDGSDNADALAQVSRTITSSEDGRFRVNLTIQKENLTGFAKLQEIIPRDYTALSTENEGAVFNIVDNKVKFVWFDIPEASDLTVAYDLIPVTNNPKADFDIDGEFSFLVDNETQTVIVNAPTLADEPEMPAESPTAPSDEITETMPDSSVTEREEPAEITEEPIESAPEEAIVEVEETENWEEEDLINGEEKATTSQEQEITEIAEVEEPEPEEVTEQAPESVQEPEPSEPQEEAPTISSMPETSISYRVQITAAHKLVDDAYFKSRHQYTGSYKTEHHEGWIKYTTGGFDVYRSARDHRNELTSAYNFPGPFVTAYNEGERITVQEALMIANQKWVP